MEVQRSWSAPALLILAAAAPWVASIRDSEFDVDQAHRASASTNASVGSIPWGDLHADISNNAEFEQDAYLGKVSSSYAWRARTIMDLGQADVPLSTGKMGEKPMKKMLPCVIKVPCQEFWTGDGEHKTGQLFFGVTEPEYSNLGATDESGDNYVDNVEESPAHADWRTTQELIFWAENDCEMANHLHENTLPVVPCLYNSKRDAESNKHIMFNVFEDYAPATLAWNEFVPDKSPKQIAKAFYDVMRYSLDAVKKLHELGGVEKIHHYLTLDSIALQLSEDGQHVGVKLTNFERMTSADFGSEPTLKKYLTAHESGTWDYYPGSPPEVWTTDFSHDHAKKPQAFDVFMLGCALLHMMTGAAPQDMVFLLKHYSYKQTQIKNEDLIFYKGDGDQLYPKSPAKIFYDWLVFHTTTANQELTQGVLRIVVNVFIHQVKEGPHTYKEQPWYPEVERVFAPELPNVRHASVANIGPLAPDNTGPLSNFYRGVLNIIEKMMSFNPEARPSIEEIISNQMPVLKQLLEQVLNQMPVLSIQMPVLNSS